MEILLIALSLESFVVSCPSIPGITRQGRDFFARIACRTLSNPNPRTMADDKRVSVTDSTRRAKSVAEEQVTSVLGSNEVPVFDRELTADEEVLAALGYKYGPAVSKLESSLT